MALEKKESVVQGLEGAQEKKEESRGRMKRGRRGGGKCERERR